MNNHSPSLMFCSDMTSLMDLSDKIPALWNIYEAPRSISNLNSKKYDLQPETPQSVDQAEKSDINTKYSVQENISGLA